MINQNITLDISEKNEDNNPYESNSDSGSDSGSDDDIDVTQEQQKKIDGWLNKTEENLKELEKLKKQQELAFKRIQVNVESKKKYFKQPIFSMFKIQNKIKNDNHIKKKELDNQQQQKSIIKHFKMKLF